MNVGHVGSIIFLAGSDTGGSRDGASLVNAGYGSPGLRSGLSSAARRPWALVINYLG